MKVDLFAIHFRGCFLGLVFGQPFHSQIVHKFGHLRELGLHPRSKILEKICEKIRNETGIIFSVKELESCRNYGSHLPYCSWLLALFPPRRHPGPAWEPAWAVKAPRPERATKAHPQQDRFRRAIRR